MTYKYSLIALLGVVFLSIFPRPSSANDDIFPPAPAAASAINFDGKGFIINGERTFIASGGMEYARVPRALWRDRLLRMKRAGFNCTEMYIFWNFHEPVENQWNFSGDHDLNAYLQLVHQLGMYAIVRIGPYVCAEWDSGGYPVWLRFKPALLVRSDNQPFLDETFKYYDKVVPIVAANQINHGGAVIMVQIENEDGDGWGTDSSLYERKLRQRVLADGIEVPTFFSGLHHGSDPAGDTPWDDAVRQNPWFTTEFWTDWYNVYGATDPSPWTRSTWKIIAFGGNGYNYYMLHGGTNFGTYNNNEDAASYDYGAAIGQGGDLRPTYYQFKEAAMFARTFQSILEDSVSSTSQFTGTATNPSLRVYGRTGPAGSIIFLDNPTSQDITTQVTGGSTVEPVSGAATVPAKKMLPIIEHYQITPSITIDQSVTQVLTSVTNGSNTTLVVYGPPGGKGSIELSSPGSLNPVSGPGWTATVQITYPATGTTSTIVGNGREKLAILAMSETLAERTWAITFNGSTDIVVGPDYVGDASYTAGKKQLAVESVSPSVAPVIDFTPDLKQVVLTPNIPFETMTAAPTLTNWQQSTEAESSPAFDDSGWLESAQPLPMGADGDYSAYAWYRTHVTVSAAATQYLTPASVGDRMILFLDGVRVPDNLVTTRSAPLNFTPGTHVLSLLTTHYGRNKLVGYAGPIDTIDTKGLVGPVGFTNSPPLAVTAWANLPVALQKPDLSVPPSTTNPDWQTVKLGTDIFNNTPGWAWYETVVPSSYGGTAASSETIHFDCVDDNATVYCNGTLVGTHTGWNNGFDVSLGPAWLAGQPNVITVLDENVAGGGGISGNVVLSMGTSGAALTNWRMRGGVGTPADRQSWQPLSQVASPALPTWFQTHFTDQPPSGIGAFPILRVHLGGMSAGFVWLNGHNLGRYPEKIPVDGLYLPECWINQGDNTLTIFDEDGNQPSGVALYTESAASRYDFVVSD